MITWLAGVGREAQTVPEATIHIRGVRNKRRIGRIVIKSEWSRGFVVKRKGWP